VARKLEGAAGRGKEFGALSKLVELLNAKNKAIAGRWFDQILATYPEESVRFFKGTKDPFHNPVGSTISREIKAIFDELSTGELDRGRVSPLIDRIVRIRAIQDYTPSQAVSFVLRLKPVVRQVLAKELTESGLAKELIEFEARVDDLALLAFDIYVSCREKIFELKAREVKNMYYNVLRRADILCPIPQQEEPDMPQDKPDK
jgi:hypothetical protein